MIKTAVNWLIDNWKEIAGILTGVWLAIKGSLRVYKWVRSFVVPIRKWIRDINTALLQLDFNGGESVKDMVYTTNKNVEKLIGNMELMMGRQVAMLHEIDTPMYECSLDGDLIDVNRAWSVLTGLSKDDAIGQGWKKIIFKEDLNYVIKLGEDFVESGETFIDTFRMQNYITKEVFKVQSTATKVFDKNKKVISIIGAVNVII